MIAAEVTTGPATFQALSNVLGQSGRVHEYWDEPESNSVAVASFVGLPEPGMTTYATVTLHGSVNTVGDGTIRTEFIAMAHESETLVAQVLATAAFDVGKSGRGAAPAVVWTGAVSEYLPGATTPHVMWTEPFVWPELSSVEILGVGPVHWLQAMPLTSVEVDHLELNGRHSLEEAMMAADVDLSDLHRASVV
ncbi:MAG: suppressor of fused domain protein [Propionibacteriales bacterium]|nr:suppressor of fused domain protein [Propionibacteriales bacterium]